MSEDTHTDEDGWGSVYRRTVLKATAATGVFAATAGHASAQESPTRTYELVGNRSGWVGVAPSEIEGETNPTLDMIPGETYEVIWENGDGMPHNFNFQDDHGHTYESTNLVSAEGETQSLTFTAEESYSEYFCAPHPQQMRGNVRIVEEHGDGGGPSTELSVNVQNADDESVPATVTVDGTDREATADGPATFGLSAGEYTVTVDADGYPTATKQVTMGEESAETTVTVASESGAYLTFTGQTTDGSSVTVDSVTLPEGGYVSVQDPLNWTNYDDGSDDEDPFNRHLESFFEKTILGASEYLEAGTHQNVEVELDTPVEETKQLVTMAHTDTGSSESFDYAESHGEEDVGYLFTSNDPVVGQAMVEYSTDMADEGATTTAPEPTTTESEPATTESPATATEGGETSGSTPGFGALTTLAGVGAGAAAAARRLAGGPEDDEE